MLTFDDRGEWLAARRRGIGASDVAGIVGLSPWATPFSVWASKVSDIESEPSEAMEWGTKLERIILDEWEMRTGHIAGNRGRMAQHPDHEWALATVDAQAFPVEEIDGELYTSETPYAGLEAKNTGEWVWSEIPIHYQCQGQWQMFVTGVQRIIFCVLHKGRQFETYELDADEEDQATLFDAAARFWTEHVITGTPPDVAANDLRLVADLHAEDDGSEVEIDQELVEQFVGVKQTLKVIQAEKDELQARIQQALGDAQIGTINGMKAVTWTTEPKTVPVKFERRGTKRVLRTQWKEGA